MTRLLAIALIWMGCLVGWMILGGTLVVRTNEVSDALDAQVHSLWGPPGRQAPPEGTYPFKETVREVVTTNSGSENPSLQVVEREKITERSLALDASSIDVTFDLEHRQKGLLWFPTYGIIFDGKFTFLNPSDVKQSATVRFPLSGGSSGYSGSSSAVSFDDFRVLDMQGRPVAYRVDRGVAVWNADFEPGGRRTFRVGYRTRGTSRWHYLLTEGQGEVKNFELRMQTSFADVDFPAGTASPTQHSASAGQWKGRWAYVSLISGAPIGIEMPQLLNPGPLASKVTFFAPVSLLFYFFVVAILTVVRKRSLHPMHYLLLGCSFFAFHLLFAYLVDRLALLPSFAIASLVSVFLAVSYARLFVGWRFALCEMGICQIVYLVLFSYSFFWQGFTGLAITLGAIVTLFLVMQVTGRVSWSEVLARPR